ncbi:MAG TPA: VCBS repeat-containing protein [Planctomycetota bacterium]|jgi:hypothetical protein|nr:VCBS repeat-containing protein [Planctomycetota bacterium]
MRRRTLLLCAGILAPAIGAQQSAAIFDAPIVVAGEYLRITNLLDLDGDSFPDAIGSWDSTNPSGQVAVTALHNDGTGKLDVAWSFNLPIPSSALASSTRIGTGDFDLDGDDDFVVSIGPDLRYYLSNGTSPPVLWATLTEPGSVEALVTADFDGDGRTDVALQDGLSLRVRLTQGGGPGPASSATLPPGTGHALFVAQVEADGLPDVGVAGFSTGTQLRLYPVSGAGAIGAPLAFTLAGVTEPMPTAGDIDGDGDSDVVVFEPTEYRVVRRTGPATFALESPVLGGPATDLADVDGDGDLDGVCCGGGGGGISTNALASHFEIAINTGGVFAPSFAIQGLGASHIAGAVDLDADGDTDLVGGRCVYYASGPIAGASLGGSVFLEDQMVGDADGDGDPDLQFGLGVEFRNAADGTFGYAPPVAPAPPAGTAFVGPGWTGDFDGDGDGDVVVEHRLLPNAFLGMRLLRNNGGGGLVDGGPAAPAGVDMRAIPVAPGAVATLGPSGAFAADADGDGDLDLVVRALVSTPGTKIWWNDGTGFFTPGPEFLYAYAKNLVNLDGNPAPDLVSVVTGSALLPGLWVVNRGLGGGSFGPPDYAIPFATVYVGDRLELVDLDGDGDLDVAGVNGSFLHLMANDGNGFFTLAGSLSPSLLTNESTSRRVHVADLDADGVLDFLVAPARYTALAGCQIHRGTGVPFAFGPAVQQMFAPRVLSDADGDGDLDGIGEKVSRNRTFSGPSAGIRAQYGAGLAGTGGMVPTLGGVGPFRSAFPCETRITGGIGGGLGVFAIGDQPASVPIVGGTLLTTVLFLFGFPLGGTPGVAGEGSATIPWTAGPGLGGLTIYQQVGILDPGAPQGVSLTNGLRYTIGP